MDYSELFNKLDCPRKGYLSPKQIKELCEQCFCCSLDAFQVEEALLRVCGRNLCSSEHLRSVIGEVAKLIQTEKNIRWEFRFLDKKGSGRISVSDALFLFKSVLGRSFSLASWQMFLSQRPNATSDDVTYDELKQSLLGSTTHSSSNVLTTSFNDYMENKLELERMELEQKQAICAGLQKLVAEISEDEDNLDGILDHNEITSSSKVSLVDRAAERLQKIERNGLSAFSFSPPQDDVLVSSNQDYTTTHHATTKKKKDKVKKCAVDNDDTTDGPALQVDNCAKENELKRIINTSILARYKCLAEKLLADLVVCNHADVPRVESLQNDYSRLITQLPNDLRDTSDFSVDAKWNKAVDKLFSQCDVHLYCLALIEADSQLLKIFDNKVEASEKVIKLVQWLGNTCKQEMITTEKSLSQKSDLSAVHKMMLYLCYLKSAVQSESDFSSAIVMSKLLQLSFQEIGFIQQHKESSLLCLLHMLLASTRMSPSSFSNALATSLCSTHDVVSKEMTEYLQSMVIEVATHRNFLQCQELIRILKSKNLGHLLKRSNSYSIDSALLRYKQLKTLHLENANRNQSADVSSDETLMEALAIRCLLMLTHTRRSSGTNNLHSESVRILADLQKLQVNSLFVLLDKICEEDQQMEFSKVVETTELNSVSLISQIVFPSKDLLLEYFYDTSVYTEVAMEIRSLYMLVIQCLLWNSFKASDQIIHSSMSSLTDKQIIFFIMEKFACLKSSDFTGFDQIFPTPIKGGLINSYVELLKYFCSKRTLTLRNPPVVLTNPGQKIFASMEELISDFLAAQKDSLVQLQLSAACLSLHQCMENEISLFRTAENFKGHVTFSNEMGAALMVAVCHMQYQEIYGVCDTETMLCLLARGLQLRHFDGSCYMCEAPLLQCFLAHKLLTGSDNEGMFDGDGEYESLTFSSSSYVSRYKALLSTAKEESSQSIELLSSILTHMNMGQSSGTDVTTKIHQVCFHAIELYYHKSLTSQSRDLLGDQIYYNYQLVTNSYQVSPSDGKWILLSHVMMALDQKLWNLISFLVSKGIKEADSVSKRLAKHHHNQLNSLLITLCQVPTPDHVIFHYNDVLKFHCVSALLSKFNSILNRLPHLSQTNDMSAQTRSEWLAKFWSMQKNNELDGLVISDCSGLSLTLPLDVIFQKEQTANADKVAESYSCTIAEVAAALSDTFSAELKQVTSADLDHLRSHVIRLYWEQLSLNNLSTLEISLAVLNIMKGHLNDMKINCQDQLRQLAQMNKQKLRFSKDATTAFENMSNLTSFLERYVRNAKKSNLSIDEWATFGDVSLHISAATIAEMVKKHQLEEKVFCYLCNTICTTQITETMSEEESIDKLKLDRQQWRLSAEVVGAQTEDFTATITGVLILDEHHIKKREAHVKLLHKALVFTLTDAWKQQTEQTDLQTFMYTKVAELFVQLIQIQLDEAYETIRKLLKISVRSQKEMYSEYRTALVQCWLDNIAAILLGIDPNQNKLMSKTMRVNLQQGRHLNKRLQSKKDRSVKARRSATKLKRRASLSPYISEDEHGSTSSLLSAVEEENPQQEEKQNFPELSFQAQLKMMANIEKEFQSEKMKILSQLEERKTKMEESAMPLTSKLQTPNLLSATPDASHQQLRNRVKSAGALKMKERMKERRRQKLAKMETQLDYEYNSADEAQESDRIPSKDETITKLSQLEKLYEEKKKVLLSSLH